MTIRKLYLELTDQCNLNCQMCYRRSWENNAEDISSKTFYRVLEDIKKLECLKEIVLGGMGEPTVSNHFIPAMEKLKDHSLCVTTNGVIDDYEVIKAIARLAGKVIVSIDGLDQNFNKIRGGQLEKVCETISIINSLKNSNLGFPEIHIQFVLSEDNINDIMGVMDLSVRMRAKSLIISNLIPMTEDYKEKILYTRYENKRIRAFFHFIWNESFKKGISVQFPNFELKTERRCSFIESDAALICSSGDVVPCLRLSHCYDEFVFGKKKKVLKHRFGNINQSSLQEIWNSSSYRKFRECVLYNMYPSCIDCDWSDGCDFVRSTESDCYGCAPSCGDCLWSRRISFCT